MSSEFNLPQVIPLITTSIFEVVLDRIFDILVLEEVNQRLQADILGRSQGTLTLAVNPLDGETMTVDAKVYIFEDNLTDVDGNIQIGTDLAATQANIVAAFNLSGVAGVQYANLMTAHTTVDIAAFSETNEAILTAKISGVAGDLIATTQTFSDGGNFFDAVTLGTTRAGSAVNTDDFGFRVLKQIANPFQAGQDFKVPVVNVLFSRDELKGRSDISKKGSVTYIIEVYAEEASTETVQGMTISSQTVNRVMRQILYILESPKYHNLRFDYQDDAGNLVKFIEKLSVTTLEGVWPKDPFPKENVTVGKVTFKVDMVENLFDLKGAELELITTLVNEPLT